MSIRTTTATALTVLALTVTGCSSSDGDDGGDGKSGPAATSPSPTATPTVDAAAARQACKDGWVRGLEDGTVDKGQIPTECDGVPNSAQIGMEALRERNTANRERLDECLADPACTEMPIP